MKTRYAVLADLAAILVFAAIGRGSHAEAVDPGGVLQTAVPFLVSALLGWAIVLFTRRNGWKLVAGVIVWASTLTVGMILRVWLGGSTPVAFVLVAGSALAVLILGWRVLLLWLHRRRPSSGQTS